MTFDLTILGSNSATPAYGRNQTSQILSIENKLYLIDCGEGTQLQLIRYGIKASRIKHIFISHLHGDHYLGLVGLLSSMHLGGRKDELSIYGPPALQEIIDIHLLYSDTRLRYPVHFIPTVDDQERVILQNEHITVRSFPLNHRIPCTGFRFDEPPPLAKINRDVCDELNIPSHLFSEIKKGGDYIDENGTIHQHTDLTLPPKAPRSYAYCSDTLNSGVYFSSIENVSLLYHEATFLHGMLVRAQETYHTTALEAGQIALKVGAKKLLIGHFSARYRELSPLLEECRSIFPNSHLATEGRMYHIEN